MDADRAGKLQSTNNRTASSAEEILIARKLPARSGGFKVNRRDYRIGTGLW